MSFSIVFDTIGYRNVWSVASPQICGREPRLHSLPASELTAVAVPASGLSATRVAKLFRVIDEVQELGEGTEFGYPRVTVGVRRNSASH